MRHFYTLRTHIRQKALLLLAPLALNLCLLNPTSASDSPTNLWQFRYHVEEGGELTMTAVMHDLNNPPPDYKPKVPGGVVTSNWEWDLKAPARLIFHTPTNGQFGMKYTAGYYRGSIYAAPGSRIPNVKGTNYVSIFSNRATSELIAAVDHGFIYTSTNFGMTWDVITAPGPHEFHLDPALDGSGFCAHASIEPLLPPTNAATATNAPLTEWYAVASSADGSKLVVTASVSQPAPTLNIRYSISDVTIAWPAQYTTFTLEHTTDLSGGTWTTITNSVQVVEGENRVVVPPAIGNHFFRLRSR